MRIGVLDSKLYFLLGSLSIALAYFVFDQRLAIAYTVIVLADFIWYTGDKNRTIRVEKNTQGRFKSATIALMALAGFFLITSLIISFIPSDLLITGETLSLADLVRLGAATVPDLEGSFFADFLGFALIAAFVETSFFFGRLPDTLPDIARQYFGFRIPIKSVAMYIFLASLFTIFHFIAKGFRTQSLMITFVFGLVSYWLVVKYGHLRESYLLHFFNNALQVLIAHNVIAGG